MKKKWIEKIKGYGMHHGLWKKGGAILLAVSGGPDSLGLLLFFKEIQKECDLKLGCCSVHHHLREEAEEEVEYVRSICQKLDIPFYRRDINVTQARKEEGGSLETVARKLRYQELEKIFTEENYDAIATAHHGNDQAETMVFHFLRGSGMKGLSGIAPKRDHIIRPFLCTTKEEILEEIRECGFRFFHDKTNDIPDTTRNKIRLELMPELLTYNPSLVETLSRMGGLLREQEEYLEAIAEEKENSILVYESENALFFKKKEWKEMAAPLGKRILHRSLKKLAREEIDFQNVENIWDFLQKADTHKETDAGGVLVTILGDEISLIKGSTREKTEGEELFRFFFHKFSPKSVPAGEKIDIIKGANPFGAIYVTKEILSQKPKTVGKNQWLLDGDLVGDLEIKIGNPKDFLEPKGLTGKKTISSILKDKKIPPILRDVWPSLGDEKHIYWTCLLKGSKYGLVNEQTKKFLLITICLGGKKHP